MTDPEPRRRFRFATFEADEATGEVRRQGLRVRLNSQPFQLLLMLLERPGELVARDEIARRLWPDGTFVDFDHGVNSAINRLREALGDTATNPRFIETLARRGYRFIAPVEKIGDQAAGKTRGQGTSGPADQEDGLSEPAAAPLSFKGLLATREDLPAAPRPLVQLLFVLFQLMYLAFYVGALANMAEIEDLLAPLPHARAIYDAVLVSAAVLIPVRAFALFAAIFHAPHFRLRFLRLWPFLLIVDAFWALSPFLLLHHISMGLAIACMALLVYSPFAQRSIVLMGAGEKHPQ